MYFGKVVILQFIQFLALFIFVELGFRFDMFRLQCHVSLRLVFPNALVACCVAADMFLNIGISAHRLASVSSTL